MDVVRSFREITEAQRYHADRAQELQEQRAATVRRMDQKLYLSHREIAEKLGLSVDDVRTLLQT
jgi:DNA-directed RNA polymerase specialized sigma24 family protein